MDTIKHPPNPNSWLNSNNFVTHEEWSTLWHLLRGTLISLCQHIGHVCQTHNVSVSYFFAILSKDIGTFISSFKDVFLSHLGLSPLDDGPWPLKVSQRCLGILARVLLARQQNSLRTQSGMDIPECVTVWNRLISTLSDLSLQEEDASSLQGMLTWLLALTVLSPQFYSSWWWWHSCHAAWWQTKKYDNNGSGYCQLHHP